MNEKRQLAELIYEKFRDGNVQTVLSLIRSKLRETGTPFVGTVGKGLGKLLEEEWVPNLNK